MRAVPPLPYTREFASGSSRPRMLKVPARRGFVVAPRRRARLVLPAGRRSMAHGPSRHAGQPPSHRVGTSSVAVNWMF